MKWFEHATLGGAQRAKFAEVGAGPRRVPSWLPGRASPERARSESASLRPPKLPSEFVDAVRHELDPEYAAKARKSLPAESLARLSEKPQAPAPSAPRRSAVPAAPATPAEPPGPDPMLVAAFEQALLLLARERERLLVETAGQVAELAALIARRVIGRELTLDPHVVRDLVQEGIEALGQHDRVVVRLGTAFEPARAKLEEDLRREGATFEVHVDAGLGAYGCVIETELGQVDESIETRLETLLHALRPNSNPPP